MHKRYAKKDGHIHCETEQCDKFKLADRPSTNCAIFLHLIVTFISTRVKKLANFGNEIKENCYGYNLRENAFCVLVIQTGASAISMKKKTSIPTLPHPKVNISGVNIA